MEKKKQIIVLQNGEERHVLRETSRFWVCEGATFRKSNPIISEVKSEKAQRKKAQQE